jgi:hypothetical protein
LHKNLDHELTDVVVATQRLTGLRDLLASVPSRDTNTAVIHTTSHHPFWDATKHRWVDAANLQPGHKLTGPQGQTEYVTRVDNYVDTKYMYNLTVANLHTYYVMAGTTPVLVHNVGTPCEEVGLEYASLASSSFERPGGMSGTLFLTEADAPIDLSTGQRNLPPGFSAPAGAVPGYEHHLEVQAVAEMQATGAKTGTLFISGNYICGACADNISAMLPRGSTLTVVYRDSKGVIQSVPFPGTR